jgi:hypothetical protein
MVHIPNSNGCATNEVVRSTTITSGTVYNILPVKGVKMPIFPIICFVKKRTIGAIVLLHAYSLQWYELPLPQDKL